jgi:hypothetical protein
VSDGGSIADNALLLSGPSVAEKLGIGLSHVPGNFR